MAWKTVARQQGLALILILQCLLPAAVWAGERVRVGLYENSPKVSFGETGRPEGIFVDIIEAIAVREDWEIEYVPGTWSEGLERLAGGQIELMPDVALTAERERLYAFHREPVLSSWNQVYARRASGIRSLPDLDGKRVAVLQGSTQRDFFNQMVTGFGLGVALQEYPDFAAAFRAVADGRADAVVTNRFYGLRHAAAAGLEDTAIVFNPSRLHFAAPKKNNPELLAAIDRHLTEFKKDATSPYYRSLRRWTSDELGPAVPRWLTFTTLAIAALLLASVIWAVTLRRTTARLRDSEGRQRQLADQLADASGFLDALVDNIPNPVFYKDTELRFVGCNRAYEEAFGVKRADLLGKTVLDLEYLPPEHRRTYQAEQERLLAANGTLRREAPMPFADGRTHQTLFLASSFRRGDGSSGGLVGVIIDITPLKETEAALRESGQRQRQLAEELGHIFARSRDAICVFDEETRFVRVSEASEKLWGYRPEELLGRCYLDMVPLDDRALTLSVARRIREGEPVRTLESRFCRKDGTLAQMMWSAVWSPAERLWYCIARDDSERRRLLDELESRAEALARNAAELAVAKDAAEAADRIKSAFLATMSHELRTPLNSIIGFTGLVLQELPGPLNDEQKKQLGMVRDSSRHLLALINDVLDISKIEAGELKVACEPFDLGASVDRVAGIVAPLAEKKGLALRIQGRKNAGEILGDARRVEQILFNLLSNAIKFTEAGAVTLSVVRVADYISREGAAPGEAVRLCVADTGIGIRPEDLALLFQPFRQVDSALTRQHEGTGLGLAICRRLAALMGGIIEAESRFGEGSAFSVTLPLAATTETA